jgi:hypothetical protein
LVDLWSTANRESLHAKALEMPIEFLRDLLVVMRQDRKAIDNVAIRKGVAAYLEDGVDTAETKTT